MYTGTSTTATSASVAAASICIPPWPGGVTRWGGPLGVRGAHSPPVDPRWPRELPPYVPIGTREETNELRHDRRHFHQLVLHLRHRRESRGRRRHFHQLFRQLRLLERRTLQSHVLKNLGHFDDLLDVRHRLVEDLQHFHHRVHRLRRRNVEERDDGQIDNLLHGVPRDSLLRSGHDRQPVRPRAPGGRHIIHVQRIVHGACRLGRGMPPDLRRKVQLEIPLPGPGLLLSP